MKLRIHYILMLMLLTGAASCKKDNYEEPESTLKGRLVYNGEAIGVEYNQVRVDLYQPGFGKTGAIEGSVAQDGSYSVLVFNGAYKLIIPVGQGPFRWRENAAGGRDTLAVSVSGAQTLDLEVLPYYMVRNVNYSVSGSSLTAAFRLDKIITDANAKNVAFVALYINKTQFVSATDRIAASAELAGTAITDPANIRLNVVVPTIVPAQNYVFARVGVRIEGVQNMIFSPLQKIQL
jgi:hypothetical protein